MKKQNITPFTHSLTINFTSERWFRRCCEYVYERRYRHMVNRRGNKYTLSVFGLPPKQEVELILFIRKGPNPTPITPIANEQRMAA